MKLIKIMMMTLLLVVFVGCSSEGQQTDTNVDALNPLEKEETEESLEGPIDTDVEKNDEEVSTQNDSEDVSETKEDQEESTATESETTDPEVTEEDNDLEEALEEVLLEDDEYQVLDLSELEDENEYDTGLVFIVQEGDIWRVVDRRGNIYRVSTSYEGIVPGIVNTNAKVTKDDEGNAKVSLSRDYDQYSNYGSINVVSSVEEEFSIALLEEQLKAGTRSKISSYSINDIASDVIGKGIRVITMNFNVVPSEGATYWGSESEVKNISYTYTVYGYESTWLLPLKAPLYLGVASGSDSADLKDIDGNTSLDNNDAEANTDIEANTENTNIDFDENEFQKIIAEVNGKIYYTEKELLAQVDGLIGTEIYEHNMSLVEYDPVTNNSKKIISDIKNGNFKLLKVYNNKIFLVVIDATPAASGGIVGLGFINVDDLTYRNIYSGEIVEGINVNDKAYIFTNDQLVEIDLNHGSIRIVNDLPLHLDFYVNSVKVLDYEDGVITTEISYETKVVTYTIDITNGEMTEIDTFVY